MSEAGSDLPVVAYSAGTRRPSIQVPANACDCHMHILDDAQPTVAEAVSVHPAASLAQYAGLQRRLGTTRFVNVTPSIYGTDNSVLLASLRDAGDQARGVAVVNDRTPASTCQELTDAGVRGARFNLVQRGATRLDMASAVASTIAPFDWHLQVHARPQDFLHVHEALARLPVTVVVDHIGCVAEDERLQPEIERKLMQRLDSGKLWLKLSGPYFSARNAASRERLAETLERLIASHSERLLWGSDWPHATEKEKPDDSQLLDFLLQAATSAQIKRILVGNPVAVYAFKVEPQ